MVGRGKRVPKLSNRLKEVLLDSELRFVDIENQIGVNHTNLSQYCSGDMMPSVYNLYALCKLLNVSADWLLGLKD